MALKTPDASAGAETIAIEGLAFLATDERLFDRFCGITGLSAGEMRAAAGHPGFLGGVLDFIVAHEPTLLAFAEETNHTPEAVASAARQLGSGRDVWESS